jgi:hypothetical protein
MEFNKGFYRKLYTYFTHKLGVREYRNGWLKGDCPNCGKLDKFGIHLNYDRTNCFSCGYHPKPAYLVMLLEGVTKLKDVLNIVGEYREGDYIQPILKPLENKSFNLPDGYVNIILGESTLANLARKRVLKRGFNIEDVALKGWGYCTRGEYFGYLIMPIYMNDTLVYFNARRLIDSVGAKYKNPPIDDTGIGKSMILYNSHALAMYKEVYLVEGLINAETLGMKAISSGGKMISRQQLSIILKSPIESIIMLLDPDAIKESIDLALEIVNHKRVKVCYWEGKKDVNDMGRDKTLKIVNKTPYHDYSSLIRFKNKIIYEKRSLNTY